MEIKIKITGVDIFKANIDKLEKKIYKTIEAAVKSGINKAKSHSDFIIPMATGRLLNSGYTRMLTTTINVTSGEWGYDPQDPNNGNNYGAFVHEMDKDSIHTNINPNASNKFIERIVNENGDRILEDIAAEIRRML